MEDEDNLPIHASLADYLKDQHLNRFVEANKVREELLVKLEQQMVRCEEGWKRDVGLQSGELEKKLNKFKEETTGLVEEQGKKLKTRQDEKLKVAKAQIH
jgi:hypothetical protein